MLTKLKQQPAASKFDKNRGHILVALLVTVVVTTIVGGALVGLVIVGSQNALGYEQMMQVQHSAESGAENAIRCILRDPAYSGGTLQINGGTVTIDVSGADTKQIEVTAEKNGLARKVNVTLSRINGVWTVNSWDEEW